MSDTKRYEGQLVSVEDVTRSFGSGKTLVNVLQGIDLSVNAGELVALFGPSGSGKTTLLNLIGALDTPSGGTVYFRDTEGKLMKQILLTAQTVSSVLIICVTILNLKLQTSDSVDTPMQLLMR